MFERAVQLAQGAVREGACPCAVLAIGQKEKVFVKTARGRLRLPAGPEATAHTRFDMASVTKVLATSMLAFRAVEAGDLCLWDPVSRFFPVGKDKEAMSILHLMTHTSGLPAHIMLRGEISDPAQAVSCILNAPLIQPVGKAPLYSCMGFILLGKILEKIYGAGLDALSREMVFKPLGMGRTGYLPAPGNIAATELNPETGQALCGVVHDENARFLGGVSGNAGVFSDIDDMIRFASMLACNGLISNTPFLSPAMLRAATHNYTPGFDVHRGLGFHLAGTEANFMGDLFPETSFGHTGFTGTSLAVDPETGFYVILLTNRVHPARENTLLMRVRRQLHNAAYSEFSKLTGVGLPVRER